jgi:hypothetical protein
VIESILKVINSSTLEEISSNAHEVAKNEVAELKRMLTASAESIEALKEVNTAESARKLREEQKKVVAALAEARRDGNAEAELQLTEQFDENRAALREAAVKPVEKPAAPAPAADPTADPGFVSWKAENPWFMKDMKKTRQAISMSAAMRADPEFAHLTGKDFFDRVTSELEDMSGGSSMRASPSKVESGRGTGDTGGGGRQSYADIPAEDRAICDRQASKLVGQGRAYEKIEDWRKAVTQSYFKA